MSDDLGRRANRAAAWVGLASAIVATFDAITLAVLMSQWVSKEHLGIATLAATLFYYLDLVTEAGLSSVLIQREKLEDETVSSVFWLNVLVSSGAFVVLLGVAPVVGMIQGAPIVGWMLIAYGCKLLYQNVYFVPAALLRREMRFKELSVVRTIANAGDVAAKLGFAALGEPVWCFVAGPLARVALTGIGLQVCRPWWPQRPRREALRRAGARDMLKYALKTTGSQWFQHFYNNFHYQIVGYFFGQGALGLYRLAYEIVLYPVNLVSNVVTQVTFPVFSRLRTTPDALAAQFLRFSRQNLATVLPVLVLAMVSANDLLIVVFSQSPADAAVAATAARLLCVVGVLRAIDCLYLPLLDGLGLPGRNLTVAGIAAAVLTTCDVVFGATLGGSLGFVAIVVGRIVGYPIIIGLHAWLALRAMNMRTGGYLRHLIGVVACGAGAVVPGLAIDALLHAQPPLVRLLAAGGGALLVVGVLLHVALGLGPRAIMRELKAR